jgi:drug/metabolite transporter (DMT)-like permease
VNDAYAKLVLVILFWAANFPLGKLALGELSPLVLTAARAALAAPLLFAVARLSAPLSVPLRRHDYLVCIVLGVSGPVANSTLWYWGLDYTTALNAGIIGAASPIFVALAASLLLGDHLPGRAWVGIGLSVAAVALTIAKGSLATLMSLSVNRGDLILLLSQSAWIGYSVYSRAAASTLPPVWVMAGANLVGALALVPLSLAIGAPWPPPWRAPLGWAVVLYGVGPSTLGHLWFYQIVRRLGPGRTATFLNLMPFVVIGLAWAMLGEAVHVYHVVGAALVIAGVVLTTRGTATSSS